MKTHETFPGKTYVVTSKVGCTITDASGELDETCEPGKQKVISAPSDKLYTSEHAVVRETFNRAARALRMLAGGVDSLAHKYDLCTSVKEMQAIDANYMADLNTGKIKVLPLLKYGKLDGLTVNPPSMPLRVNYDDAFPNYKRKYMRLKTDADISSMMNLIIGSVNILEVFSAEMPNCKSISYIFNGIKTLKKFNVKKLPKCTESAHSWASAFLGCENMPEFHTEMPALKIASHYSGMFEGCKIFSVCSVGFPSLEKADRMFYDCILNKESVINILDSLKPSTGATSENVTWKIGLGIHVDHQTDGKVIAAIEAAEAKGWTLIVQWNGTPTASGASTFALRRRMPVFARLGEPLEDGTPRLDWGHYVTDPSGYMEFASLEEAKEHFNITD